jgi:2,3-diketo-5-methylthio-1-phosphopentane phosphatase
LLCDFDGTIVPGDVEFEMFARFGGPDRAGDVVARWERGELTAKERIEQGFARLHVSRAALEKFIDDFPFDPTFAPFARFCQEQRLPLAVISEGLAWYIRRILDRAGVGPLPLLANEITFADPADISTARVSFPYFNGDCNPCRQCGCCKRYLMREQRAAGRRVAFISDGRSDRFAAREADLLFARDHLLEYCQGHGLAALPFADFDDVRRGLLDRFEPVTAWQPRAA